MRSYQAPTGTRDVLPPESGRWQLLTACFADLVGRAGYGLIVNPMFEDAEVFQRMGEGSDVVRKEMYDFQDKGGRRLALRPEGTASVVRAFVQHRPVLPWKVWYVAPSFRYERPQAGRYRQHHQLGMEVLGSTDPDVDIEVVALAWDFYAALGLRQVVLALNSIGDPVCRPAYVKELETFLLARQGELCREHRDRVKVNPLRVLDCKRPECRAATVEAPSILDHLCAACLDHFAKLRAGLDELGVPFVLDPRLVRGLDYYTRTTFEFQAPALDTAQSTVGAGGRYDGLVEELGGPPTPGFGIGIGVERVLLACDAEGAFPVQERRVDVWVVDVTAGEAGRDLTWSLRRAGISADRGFGGRSMRAQMKLADRSGARLALIVGADEEAGGTVSVRDLRGEPDVQHAVARPQVVSRVRELLG